MKASPVARVVAASLRHARLTVILAALITGAALLFVSQRFAMTTDTAALISANVDWRRNEIAMDTAFPQLRDAMVIVIDGATPELAEDAAARLTQRLAGDSAHFRRVMRPDGGEFLARAGLLFASADEVKRTTQAMIDAQPLLGPLAADPSLRGVAGVTGMLAEGLDSGMVTPATVAAPFRALTRATDSVLAGHGEPFSWQRLFAGGDPALVPPTRRLVLAQPVLDRTALMPGEAASAAVHAAAAALGLDRAGTVRVQLTGEVPLADEEFATIADNIGLVALVMVLAMLVTLGFATRSLRQVAAILVTIVVGLVLTTALGLVMVGRFNVISVAFIPLFVGLGVDFCIQICVRYNAERVTCADPADALIAATRALERPLLLAAAAIFLGFAAFLPTAYVGIAELGLIAGAGMVVTLVLSLTLLPALVRVLGAGRAHRDVGMAALAPVDRWLERRRAAVLWAFVIAMVASVATLGLVSFDFNPLHLRDPQAPAMRALADLTRDPDRTPQTIDVLAGSEAEARTLAARLAALPEALHVVWIDSFVPADQAAKLATISDAQLLLDVTLNPLDVAPPPGDAERVAALTKAADSLRALHDAPDARALGLAFDRAAHSTPAKRAELDALLAQPLAVMLDQMRNALQASEVTRATLPADWVRDWVTPDGRYRIEVFPRGTAQDNAAIRRFSRAVAAVAPAASGLPVATQAAAGTVAYAFVEAGVLAFVLVSVLLYLALRDAREVVFTLTPVVLSIFLTLGTCVLVGIPINFANIIAFPLLLGVGTAFHIYFVMAWRGGATGLLQSSLARAVVFSALATGTAFGSLWLSHHPGTASMGKILMLSLVWTLICALIFEPALLGPVPEARKTARR